MVKIMAEVVKCENGHYYDKSVFTRCPHCEAGIGAVRKTTGYRNEVSRYAMEYLQEQRSGREMPQADSAMNAGRNPVWERYPEQEEQRNIFQREVPDIQDQETVFIGEFQGRETQDIFQGDFSDRGRQDPVSQRVSLDIEQGEPVSHRIDLDAGKKDPVSRGESLNMEQGEPVSIFYDRTPDMERKGNGSRQTPDYGKDDKTIGFSSNNQKNYMVTGWLVCVDGPHKGYSFNLYYGFNTIGYSRNNRISLLEDTSVAKKVHCSVVYEDRKNCFYLVPEEGQETYLNDQHLTEASELKNEDRIHIGETQFVFIAFCGGERKWDRKLMRR